MNKRGELSRMHVTRLRVLGRGWGRFRAENVTVVVAPESEGAEVRSAIDLIEVLDLDDEDAETGLPYGRERRN